MLELVGGEPDGVAEVEDQRRWVEELFVARYRELVGLATVITGDRSLAEDIVQDVFASLYRRSEPLDDPDGAVGFLRRSTVNGARDRLRRRAVAGRAHPVVETGRPPSTEDAAIADDDARAVAVAVALLSPRQRECIACHYELGLTHVEAAAALGITLGSVKTHLHRATRRLATLLEDRR